MLADADKSITFIKEIVSAFYGIDKDCYDKKTRKEEFIKVKHVAIYICKKEIKISSVKLGKMFGVDHATVIYIVKKFNGYLEWDSEFRKEIEDIENILRFKIANELNLDKEYYYIPLNDFTSIKKDDGKAIILKGFSEEEITALKFIDERSGKNFFKSENDIKNHKNKKLYILEKK